MQTHTSLVYGMLQDTQNNLLCGFPKDKQSLKKPKKLTVNHVGNASKIWTEELLTASESHFTVRNTQSEHHWVWGEVLTPKVSRPWKQSNEMYVLWSFLARMLHPLQPSWEAEGDQHQGLCFCHNVIKPAVFYTSLDNTTASQLSALQDIRLRLSIPSFSSLSSSLCPSYTRKPTPHPSLLLQLCWAVLPAGCSQQAWLVWERASQGEGYCRKLTFLAWPSDSFFCV